MFIIPRLRRVCGRVGPRLDTVGDVDPPNSVDATRVHSRTSADRVMSSPTDFLRAVDAETRCPTPDEDEFWSADVVREAEVDRGVRQLRVAALASALVPLSCLCVVAGMWTSSGASVVLTRNYIDANATPISILCCARRHPSTLPENCWISPNLDVDGVRSADARSDADRQLADTWSNVSTHFGCGEVLPRRITRVDDRSNNCTPSTFYCVDVYCNETAGATGSPSPEWAFIYGGKIESSAATAWNVAGLTTMASVAVVGLGCLASASMRFHRRRLRTVVVEERAARVRRRAAVEDLCRCDRLLADMLPPDVAARLKVGQRVDPETFDVASVYFSDIVGFNDVALNCKSPLVIVRLLNQVFRYIQSRSFLVQRLQLRFDVDSTGIRLLIEGHYVHSDVTR